MEDIEKQEDIDETDTESEDTSTEIADEETEETEEESEESSQDIDYEKELAKVEGDKKPELSEADKAKRALFFNAQRAKELGVDVEEAIGIKKPKEASKEDDVDAKLERKFAERDAQAVAGSEAEFKLIMWYVDNRGLSVDDAYVLANKGKLQRAISEGKRSNVTFAKAGGERKVTKAVVPQRSPEEQQLLLNRGLKYNPKTQTYQGKFTEEYYDPTDKAWKSRNLKK